MRPLLSHLALLPPSWPCRQDLDLVRFNESFACDAKQNARRFHLQNGPKPVHYFDRLEDLVAKDSHPHCHIHAHPCQPPAPIDLFVCGFPCAPFSSQRSTRGSSRSRFQNVVQTTSLSLMSVLIWVSKERLPQKDYMEYPHRTTAAFSCNHPFCKGGIPTVRWGHGEQASRLSRSSDQPWDCLKMYQALPNQEKTIGRPSSSQ